MKPKPKGRQSCSSSSFSPPLQKYSSKKSDPKSRYSISSLNLDEQVKSPDETLFETLMKDPLKRVMVLKILSQEKDNIERYKKTEKKLLTKRMRNQRLLHCESPTALHRRRLLEKERPLSAGSSSTTSDSKSVTPSPIPFQRILEGVVAYVEIRSKEGDRSAGAKALMQSMGAIIMNHFGREVTHVVFKDGSFNTYQKAKLMKVHLVSVLWLEAVRKNNIRVPEKNYPALGTEAYDLNISAICQDYEEVVRDEYKRSLAAGPSTSGVDLKGRKTGVPTELRSKNLLNIDESSDNFRTTEKVQEVVPSSQDWEAESVISYESGYPPFRRAIPNVFEDSDRLLTSDNDSECGVINGHSVRHIRDSMLVDVDSEDLGRCSGLLDKNRDESINIRSSVKEQSVTNTSSSRSVSLLVQKSIPRRKSSYSIVDMDLTDIVDDNDKNDKENKSVKAVRRKLYASPKKDKRLLAVSSLPNIIDKVDEVDIVQTKRSSNRRKTISSIKGLTTNKVNSVKDIETAVDVHKSSTLQTTGSSTQSLNAIMSKKPSENSGSDKKAICSSEDVSRDKKLGRRCSVRLSAGKIISSENAGSEINVKASNQFSLPNSISFNSETMSSLRISTETSNDAVLKHKGRKSSKSDVSNRSSTRASNEKLINQQMEKSAKRCSSRKSTRLQNIDQQQGDIQSNNQSEGLKITDEGHSKGASTNSENFPTLRISTESLTKTDENNKVQHTSQLRSSTAVINENNELSKLKSGVADSGTTINLPNFSLAEEEMVSNISNKKLSKTSPAEKRTVHGKGQGDGHTPSKRFQRIDDKPVKGKLKESSTKKVRKLYNVNQSLTDTFKNWPSQVQNGASNRANVENSAVAVERKKLVIPLTPLLFTQNATKFLKNQIANNKSITKKNKTVKQQPVSKKENTNKTQKKVAVNNEKDEQTELAKEFVTKEKPTTESVTKRKHIEDDDDDTSPKKKTAPNSSRRSERIYQKLNSSSEPSRIPIIPQLSRRSTLDFIHNTPVSTQRKLNHKLKKVKPSIVCTRLHKPEVITFMQIVKKLGKFFIEDEVSAKTTHLIVGESKRTINLLRAIARGCWILTKEWLYRSLESDTWLPEEDYELINFSSAVQQCRRQRQAFGPLYSMDIFINCGPIYIAQGSIPRRSDLEELVKLCQGTVIKSICNANIVVGEWANYDGIVCVNEKWILDSITFSKAKSYKNYLIKPKV